MASLFLRRRPVRLRHVSRVVDGWIERACFLAGVLIAAALWSASAGAQTCYAYSAAAYTATFPTHAAACDYWITRQPAVSDFGSCVYSNAYSVESLDAPPGANGWCTVSRTRTGTFGTCLGNTVVTNPLAGVPIYARPLPQCPPPDECDQGHPHIGERFTTNIAPSAGGGSYCNAVSRCKMEVSASVSGGGETVYQVTHTNQNCDAGQEETDDDDFKRESCIATAGGNEFCMSKDGENCGWFNNEFVCLDQIEDDGCQAMSDGGRLCGSQAPTPPVPDDGTPGNPAPPDDRITNIENNYWNYFSSGTVGNSHRPPNSGGDNPYDGDDGSGVKQPGRGGEDGGNSEGLMCDPSEDDGCSPEGESGVGEDPRQGWQCWGDSDGLAGAVAECFEFASQSVWNGLVNDSALLSVAVETAAAFPSGGGACPSDVVHIGWLGESFDFWEVPCMFLDDVESILGPMFLLGWSLVGLRILLTIPGGGE